jgi:hypothetical protein
MVALQKEDEAGFFDSRGRGFAVGFRNGVMKAPIEAVGLNARTRE